MVYFRQLMDSPLLHILWLAASAGITLFLPGAALLAWLPRSQVDFTQQLARAMGLSMALTALGALVTFLTGLRLSAASLVLIYAGLGLVGLAGGLRRWRSWRFTSAAWGGGVLTVLIGAGLVAWRLYQARDLVLPAWVNSVHHVLIVRAILDRGGLPGSLAPYLPVPFYYHFGFHVLAAVFSVFSRLPPDQAVLVFGQVLEAAMSLAAYRLACVMYRYRGDPAKWSLWPRRKPAAGAELPIVLNNSTGPALLIKQETPRPVTPALAGGARIASRCPRRISPCCHCEPFRRSNLRIGEEIASLARTARSQ